MKLNSVKFEDGGILKEMYKSQQAGQISMRVIPPGESSGGSLHREKDELWWVALGRAVIRLEFPNGDRTAFYTTGPMSYVIKVPAGTGHEIVNYGPEDVVLVWHSSKVYDPENPDRYEWRA